MKVWRLVITGNQEQLESPSLKKEKSNDLSKQNEQEKKEELPNVVQDGEEQSKENQGNNGQQSPISEQSNSNNQNESSQSNESQEKQSSESSSNEKSTSQQTDNNQQPQNSSQSRNNSNSMSEGSQQESSQSNSSEQSINQQSQNSSNSQSESSQSNESQEKQSSDSNQNTSNSQQQSISQSNQNSNSLSENSQQNSSQYASNEQNNNSLNQNSDSSSTSQDESQSINQETNLQEQATSNEQNSDSNQQQTNQDNDSNNEDEQNKKKGLSLQEAFEIACDKISKKSKKKKKQHQKSKENSSEQDKPNDKGRWKKNKPNRQNPKNDFEGIYRKQKKKIKAQQEKTAQARKEQEKRQKAKQSQEQEKKERIIDEQTKSFLNELQNLPPYEQRTTQDGFGNLESSDEKIPEALIKTLITKFLTQRFKKKKSELNTRSQTSLEKKEGFHKWDIPQVAIHLESKQYTRILRDKYSYEYGKGSAETIPLSFYFDLSASMSEFNPILIILIKELLKNNIKVLVGYNNQIKGQIDSINQKTSDEILINELIQIGYGSSFKKNQGLKGKEIHSDLYHYLKRKQAEKCVVFSDYDPQEDIVELSKIAQVYWFCFENRWHIDMVMDSFNGFYYKVKDLDDIYLGLVEINSKRFETLCYLNEMQKTKRRK